MLLDHRLLGRDLLVLFALVGWALAVPHYGSEFAVSLLLSCLMYVALSSSWSLFCGSTRYLSLATAAFFGIGAYTSAFGLEKLSWVECIALGAGMRGTQLAALAQQRAPRCAGAGQVRDRDHQHRAVGGHASLRDNARRARHLHRDHRVKRLHNASLSVASRRLLARDSIGAPCQIFGESP